MSFNQPYFFWDGLVKEIEDTRPLHRVVGQGIDVGHRLNVGPGKFGKKE